MTFGLLRLWADEEARIHTCLRDALKSLVESGEVAPGDDELEISAKLRRHLYAAKKSRKLAWTVHPEASCFIEDYPVPAGHPDFRFSQVTPDFEDYNYDVECKILREPSGGRKPTYCTQYVSNGIARFASGIYAQSQPALGAMIGYLRYGSVPNLLNLVNAEVSRLGHSGHLQPINSLRNGFAEFNQQITRTSDEVTITHIWADM